MLRWNTCKTEKDNIKNVDKWREANIEPMTTIHRQKILKWYGNVSMKECEDTTNNTLHMQVHRNRRADMSEKRGISNTRGGSPDDRLHFRKSKYEEHEDKGLRIITRTRHKVTGADPGFEKRGGPIYLM